MTTASKEAYANPVNQIARETHRQKCLKGLEFEQTGLTFRELAAKIGLKEEQTWKRVSELEKDKKVYVCSFKYENGNQVSVYKLVKQLELFKTERPLNFKKYAEKYHPEWVQEWKVKELKDLP